MNAKVEQVHATFASPTNTGTSWDAATKTFKWNATSYNQLRNIGLPSGDLTKYKKLVVDLSFVTGNRIRVLIYKGGANKTLYAKEGKNEFILADTLKAMYPDDYNEFLRECTEVCISGDNAIAPGEVVVNDVYFETYDDEGEKTYATFASPTNTGTSWDAATKTFKWNATSYNQLRNIGLPSGDITKYKKLVVDLSFVTGNRIRVLIYKGGANKTLYAKEGKNEFILADTLKAMYPDDYNEFLRECTEVCISGDNAIAPGEVVVNSVYLETYPENETVDIPEVVVEKDPGRPAGDFVDLTQELFSGNAILNLGKKLGKGEIVYGAKSIDAFADLSDYSKLTIVATPGMMFNINLNHQVEFKNSDADYSEEDLGKFDWINAQTGEDGIYELDLTQFENRNLNCIWTPWAYEKMGTVWYLLLTKGEAAPVAQSVTFDFNASNHATSSNNDNAGDITADEVNTADGVVMTITPADPEATTPNRYWSTANGPQLRMYSGKLTIEAPEGKAITKVVIENGKWNVGNTFNGEAAAEGTWEGNSTNVVLAVAANTQMNKVIVTLADKNEETTTYKEPLKPLFVDGKYYINNVGTKKYLAAGADWGTHAVVNELGLDYTVAFTPEGKYTLDSQVSNGGEKHFLNGEYNDGLAFGWIFAKVADGIYTISDGTKFLTAGEDGKVTLAEDGTVEAAQWTLTPAADRRAAQIASLADATAENPIDATFLFVDANFNRNDLRKSAWTGDDFSVGGTETNTNAEKWGGNSQTFDIKQTVEVPNGIYKITWNGYYRYNNTEENTNEVAAAAHADGSEVINSFVYLNDQDYPLTSIADEAAVAAFEKMPFTQGDATAAFEKGLYEQSAEITVEDGQLTIGIKKTEHPGTDWTVWDNFRITYFGVPVPVSHTWNFMKWGEETVANLKAEAVKVTVEPDPDKEGNTMCTDNGALWSDHEKAPGKTCDTYAASKDNCFWAITTPDENGELAANGVTIAELKGLSFNSTYSASRALAIAVNYPATSLGTYNGPAYLWFGGKNQEILTIKNVKAGTTITMGVESHKLAEARGVKLLVGETELTDPEGNAVAAPTTYTEQTWAVPAGEGVVDVVVKNTNGCHIYFIDAEIGEAAPEVNPDEAEKEVPEGWENLIANGNMAGDDVSNFFSKEAPAPDPYASTITPGAGKDNSRGIIIKSAEGGSQDWDSQFFIRASKAIPAGTKLHMEFDYKASVDAKVGTQGHGEPGAYVNNDGVGDVNFTTEWQHLAQDFTASGDIQTIAFNMNILRDEAEYYIDNIVFWAEKAPEIEWADVIVNGTMEENDAFNFKSKIYPDGNASDAAFTAGAGKDGSQGIVIESPAKASQAWDTQFWITLPIALEQGTKFKLEFDYKADAAVNADAQYHAAPGDYIGNWVSVGFTTEWQHFEKQAIAPAANGNGNKFQSIAFNLSFDNATNLYFDNVKLFLDKETAATAIKTVNTEVPFIEGAVYDLQGRRVAKPARGLYIVNGKKVMVK